MNKPGPKKDGLTARQEKFCHEYMVDNNALRAAIRAGYSPPSAQAQGSKQLGQEKVKAYIQVLIDQANERSKISRDMLESMLMDNIESARLKNNHNAVNNGISVLAKMKGYLVEKVEVGRAGEFENASQEEIESAIAKFKDGEQMNAGNKEPKRLPAGPEGEGSEDQKKPTPILPTVH